MSSDQQPSGRSSLRHPLPIFRSPLPISSGTIGHTQKPQPNENQHITPNPCPIKIQNPSGIPSNFKTTETEQEELAEPAKSGRANHNNTQPGSFFARSSSQKCRFHCFFSEFIPLIAGRQLEHPDASGTKKSK